MGRKILSFCGNRLERYSEEEKSSLNSKYVILARLLRANVRRKASVGALWVDELT